MGEVSPRETLSVPVSAAHVGCWCSAALRPWVGPVNVPWGALRATWRGAPFADEPNHQHVTPAARSTARTNSRETGLTVSKIKKSPPPRRSSSSRTYALARLRAP